MRYKASFRRITAPYEIAALLFNATWTSTFRT